MSGKGSKRRPMFISDDDFSSNWNLIFKKGGKYDSVSKFDFNSSFHTVNRPGVNSDDEYQFRKKSK